MIHLLRNSRLPVNRTWAYKTPLKPFMQNVRTTMNGTHTTTALRRWSCQDKPLPPVEQVKFVHVYDFDNTSKYNNKQFQQRRDLNVNLKSSHLLHPTGSSGTPIPLASYKLRTFSITADGGIIRASSRPVAKASLLKNREHGRDAGMRPLWTYAAFPRKIQRP